MTEGGTVEVAGPTITITSPDDPPVTRARVSAADMAELPATRETPARGPNGDRPGGRWSPGPLTLEELPVPVAELEATLARERRKRVRHAHRYR